jgi:nijmegen breakage syndrome protein 1
MVLLPNFVLYLTSDSYCSNLWFLVAGCDVIINKDKGVSRIHAEIVVDALTTLNPLHKKPFITLSKVRIRDCSKYGTFINKNLGRKEKVHELPNKETALEDGDLVSFGTGNATYR